MGTKKLSRGALFGLSLAPAALVVAAMFVSIPWLKTQPDIVTNTIAGVATVLVLGWSLFIAMMTNRRLDEVELASQKWAWKWGAVSGTMLIALLLALPPFRDLVDAGVNGFLMEMKGHTRQSAILGFIAGFMALSIAQTIGTIVMAVVWWGKRQ